MKKIFVSAALITILVVAIYLISGENNFLVNGAREVFSPVISKAITIEQNIKMSLTSTHDLQKENEILKKEITGYANLYSYRQEIERLEALLELRNTMEYAGETTVAKVISCSKPDTIIINKGGSSGISVGDAVISTQGVVGRVCEVGDKYAVVATILNTQSAVSVRAVRTGKPAVVEGNIELLNSKLCKMSFIEGAESIAIGDYLETNGGIVFPEGIPVGVVREVGHENSLVYATISPVVDFSKLYEVLVICRQ